LLVCAVEILDKDNLGQRGVVKNKDGDPLLFCIGLDKESMYEVELESGTTVTVKGADLKCKHFPSRLI
jgi:hypothetical protein